MAVVAGISTVSAFSGPYSGLTKLVTALGSLSFAFIVFPGLLITFGSLLRLRGIRKVLCIYAWEERAAVRRIGYVKEYTGIPVTIEKSDGEDDWGGVVVLRSPLGSKRWDERMESGAWFAGDVPLGGVMALPGGDELMKIQRRAGHDRIEDINTVRGDSSRTRRAVKAGIW